MTNKKEKSPFLVILCILFLLTFIVLPPVFRTLFPKDNVVTPTKNKETYLICNREFAGYKTTINFAYSKNQLSKVTLSYHNLSSTEEIPTTDPVVSPNPEVTPTADPTTETPVIDKTVVQEEIDFFSSVVDSNYSTTNNITKIVLTQKTLSSNKDNERLQSIVQPLSEQKYNFESMGYSCQSINNS